MLNGKRKLKSKRKTQESSDHLDLTMSVVMQSRASCSDGKAVGVDGISAESLKTLAWRALQDIKKAFELRYTEVKTRRTLKEHHCPDTQEESDRKA